MAATLGQLAPTARLQLTDQVADGGLSDASLLGYGVLRHAVVAMQRMEDGGGRLGTDPAPARGYAAGRQ